MKWFLILLLFVSVCFAGKPRIPIPNTPDLVHQNDQDLQDKIENLEKRTVSRPIDVSISTGSISINANFYTVHIESGTADYLDTINGGNPGDFVVLQSSSSGVTLIVEDGTGNLELNGDFSMDDPEDKIMLLRVSTNTWHEISRSSNGP